MASSSQRFFYFAFASNLLEQRLRLQNPTAEFVTIARLEGHCLAFDYFSGRWHGAIASITESPGDHVWGVVWSLDVVNILDLDRQEGVNAGIYEPVEVDVQTEEGETIHCRSYHLLKRRYKDKRPSPQYLDVILRGAVQHKLPEYYVQKLRAIEHNGYDGNVKVVEEINEVPLNPK